jgi:hypothetical protein
MPQKPQPIINDDGIAFAKYNTKNAKEKKADSAVANNTNFDYNAFKNLKK